MKTGKDCWECEIEMKKEKIDSWVLSILCGIMSGLAGCGLGFIIYDLMQG